MDKHETDEPTLSFVCPVYNQAERLEQFHADLKAAAESIGDPYEIVLVNDGSDDDSLAVIRRLAKRDGAVRYLDLSRRFGLDGAVRAGYDFAAGRAVITLNSDGGHKPQFARMLIEKWQGGCEIVQAAPIDAPDAAVRRCPYRLLDRKVVLAVREMAGSELPLGELLDWIGFRQATIRFPVEEGQPDALAPRRAARVGRRLAALTSLSLISVRTVATAGLVLIVAGLLYGAVAGTMSLAGTASFSPLMFILLVLVGVQLVGFAAVGHYVADMHRLLAERPRYVVRHAHGFSEERPAAPEPPETPADEASRFTVMT